MPPKQQKKTKGSLRGATANEVAAAIKSAVKQETKQKQKKKPASAGKTELSFAPVSIGTTVTSRGASYAYKNKNSLNMTGRDFLISLPETNQTNWYLSAVVPVNPAFWGSSPIGRAASVYKKFRFKKLTFQYITRQPTSSSGEIIMSLNTSANDEALSSTGSDFLSKAMSYPCSLMGPLWTNHSLVCKTDSSWSNVDCLSSSDYDDNVPAELYIYVQSAITDVVGYLMVDYEIEFAEIDYNERTSSIPISSSFGVDNITDATAPVLGAQMITTFNNVPFSTTSGPFGFGAVVKVVLNVSGTTFTAPITAANALNVLTRTSNQNLPVVDGTTLYATYSSAGTLYFYPTIEAAYTSSDTSYIVYRTAGATTTTWKCNYYVISWGSVFKT